ncbi:MAG: inner rane transporter YbgH, partial [Gammaproteobacteria bacterium]|nr:inner rane transporter YbgH [Gammaproteobacteria bacterium]
MMTDKVKASYFMIFVVMWEFFSYFGMQALLILYLTRKLHFSDIKAYAIYGAFSSLIFLTPILGGYVADRYCGYRYAVFWGCVLMIAGHLTLGLNETGLYSGLSLLILGMGLFKSNAICLIADCYADDQAAKSSALLWYYVSGNFGAILSQLLCPYLARAINWQTGFMLAAAGMALGLILFIYSIKYFSWHKSTAHPMWTSLNRSSQTGISLLSLSVGFFAIFFILKKLMVGDLLIVVSFIAAATFYAIYEQANTEQKQSLKKVVLLTIFATGFWIFDQQGSSSISLFIFRYIDRSLGHFLIPTGSFQAINPAVVLIFGSIMAFGWKYLAQNTIKPSPISKLSIGLLLLSLGFFFIAKAAALASPHHLSSMFYPFIGL